MKNLAATGANWISLLVNVGQETIASTKVFRTQPRTAADAELKRMIDLAHGLGMRVALLVNVDLSNDPVHTQREIGIAFTSEAQWQEWFASYRELLNYYATFSQEAGVDMLVIGDALVGTTQRENDWRRVIKEARERFKGPITYAALYAQGSLSDGEDVRIKWWDAVDYIGWQPFYPLTDKNDPTVAELKAAWTEKGYLAAIENLSKQFNKPVIAIEFGYRSQDGANKWPLNWTSTAPVDLQEQADCYQAALEVLWGKPWLAGIFWWEWRAQAGLGGPKDTSAIPYGKPAEEVLKKFYLSP
ncbi:MAG: hypothetical protein HYX80_06575 [Chloroflexi bacterium]|nr:hypothetical protein [Chloroflexota bacterium]